MNDHIERTKRMIEVMQAYVDGERVEFGEPWWPVTDMHSWSSNYTYRIAKTPDTINWDHVAPGYKYMKRDENGCAYLYAEHPDSYIKVIRPESANGFSSYRKGTVDWKESLVIRPVCE